MKDRILKRFNDEIAVLERELKIDLPKEIQRAREHGDLRENAEFKAAKERQEIVNARIGMLRKRAREIAMMNLERIPHGRAGFGSTVELRASTGETVVYTLVMPEEANAEKGLISTDAIDLRALIDARKRKRFLKKVFKKDEAHFDASIDTLNAMTSWKEASVFIDEIFIMNDVDPFSKDAIRFTDLVYSRFFPASSESREEEVSVPPPEDE